MSNTLVWNLAVLVVVATLCLAWDTALPLFLLFVLYSTEKE